VEKALYKKGDGDIWICLNEFKYHHHLSRIQNV